MEPIYDTLRLLWTLQKTQMECIFIHCSPMHPLLKNFLQCCHLRGQPIRLTAITPSPIFPGHLDNQSAWQIGILALNEPAIGMGLPKGQGFWTNLREHQITHIRNKPLKVKWLLVNDRGQSWVPSASVLFPHCLLGAFLPPMSTKEQLPLLTTTGDCLHPAFSPLGPLNLLFSKSAIFGCLNPFFRLLLNFTSPETCMLIWVWSEPCPVIRCHISLFTSIGGHTTIHNYFVYLVLASL